VKRIAVLVVAVAAVLAVSAQSAFAAKSASTAAVTVNVTAVDFKFRLSKSSVPKGTVVTFKVTNRGNAPHDFDIPSLRKGTAYLTKGKSASFKMVASKSGTLRYVCTVPRHAELGMAGRFLVK